MNRLKILFPAFVFLVLFPLAGLGAWLMQPSFSASASVPSVTPNTHFGLAQIPKPAYTATSFLNPTEQVTTSPTATPEPQMAYAEILQDTPQPEYFSPVLNEYEQDTEAIPYNGDKYILVDISEQHMYVYEGNALVFSFVSSTGMNNATATGTFSVLNKIPNAYGSTWDIWMPNWLGIYWAGGLQNGIHALPILPNGAQLWAGYLGTPISYGCVVLGAYEAQLLYDWAEVGTPVEIRW